MEMSKAAGLLCAIHGGCTACFGNGWSKPGLTLPSWGAEAHAPGDEKSDCTGCGEDGVPVLKTGEAVAPKTFPEISVAFRSMSVPTGV